MTEQYLLLGATGSVGDSVLMALKALNRPLTAFSFHRNHDKAAKIIRDFKPQTVICTDENSCSLIKKEFPGQKIHFGIDAACELIVSEKNLTVINALTGMSGLKPSFSTLKSGKKLIIANKESIVAGSRLLMEQKQYENQIIPIDSEHWSLFLLLDIIRKEKVREIILTSSGGPFKEYTLEQMAKVTLSKALNHPVWKMGSVITINSSTMANKGLEVIEAKELFGFPLSKIRVVIHPQAKVHAMARLNDGSLLAHMSRTSMVEPVRGALSYPDLAESENYPIEKERYDFQPADLLRFPMLKLAYEAAEKGHLQQIVYTVANDMAVSYFLKRKIRFVKIARAVEEILSKIKGKSDLKTVGDILDVEAEVIELSKSVLTKKN